MKKLFFIFAIMIAHIGYGQSSVTVINNTSDIFTISLVTEENGCKSFIAAYPSSISINPSTSAVYNTFNGSGFDIVDVQVIHNPTSAPMDVQTSLTSSPITGCPITSTGSSSVTYIIGLNTYTLNFVMTFGGAIVTIN